MVDISERDALHGEHPSDDAREQGPAVFLGRRPFVSAPLIGRVAARRATIRALESSPLVTLTGAGGIGKSRLALAVAESISSKIADEVYWVDLSSVPVDGSVDEVILSSMASVDHSRAPSITRLVDILRDRRVLIVLDNCEHVLRSVALFAANLLSESRLTRILATSREEIGSLHERVVPIEPLSLPAVDSEYTALNASTYESVALFVQRATAVRPGFQLDESNVQDVVAICLALEGWPLAIELAASRVRSLTITEIGTDLSVHMPGLRTRDVLTPARHHSLRTVIDWSWRLCEPSERLMWQRAAVFSADGFDLGAARVVCSDELLPLGETWNVLDRLVSKSVLVAVPRGAGTRYRFLETIRQYGNERRVEAGENDELHRRHRDYCLTVAADAFRGWDTVRQREAVDVLRINRANLLQAMEWSLETRGEEAAALDIAWRMVYHWAVAGSLRDGRHWLKRTLEAAPADAVGRPMAMWAFAWVTLLQGDSAAAERSLGSMDRYMTADHDGVLSARRAVLLGFIALRTDKIDEAVELLGQAVDVFEAADEVGGLMLASMLLVLSLAQTDAHDRSDDVVSRALRASETCGEQWGRAQMWWALGYTRWIQGDNQTALELVRRGLELGLDFDRVGVALRLETLAWIAASDREYERSARLLGAARSTWDALDTSIDAHGMYMARHSTHCLDVLKRALPTTRLNAELENGAAMDFESMLAYSTGRSQPSGEGSLDPRLTAREREVSELLGLGQGTREIASRLSLSVRTVEGHIGRALTKLGFESRTQLAAWDAAARRLP